MVHFTGSRPGALFHSCAPVHASRRAGYPIREPAGLRMCAPLRSFSQLAAPFLAIPLHRHPPWTYDSLDHIASTPGATLRIGPHLPSSFRVPLLALLGVLHSFSFSVLSNISAFSATRGKKEDRQQRTWTSLRTLVHCLSLRKEVIQPHLPVRLPCYDFTPLTGHTFDSGLPCGFACRLRVSPTRMV